MKTNNAIKGSNQNEQYMWLMSTLLLINPLIQRKLDPVRVAQIVREFSPLIANPIKVSFRDGKYYIFDGMHTFMALKALNVGEDFPVFCRVYYGLTKEDQARLFAAQFGASAPVTLPYRLRALNEANDKQVVDFIGQTHKNGFSITLGNHKAQNGNISAVCEAFKMYKYLGSEMYARMLDIIHKTWTGETWSVSKFMLSGMARYMKNYEVDAPSFIKVFRHVTYKEIKKEANRFPDMTRDGAFANALAEIFDRRIAAVV